MSKGPPVAFATLVRDLRQRLNLSQEKFAAQLRVSLPTVSRWEKGKTEPDGAVRHAVTEFVKSLGPDFTDLYARLAGDDVEAVRVAPARPARRGRRKQVPESVPPANSNGQLMDNRSMETLLWKAACSIRGEKDAPKFARVTSFL